MQTVSAELEAEQLKNDKLKFYRVVELYRRYYDGAAMVWEDPIDISALVVKVSPAKWKLDRRGFTEWKSPSFQLEVDDRRNFWSEIETKGIWRTGMGGVETYYSELSRVRVRMGLELPDGTREDLYVFGGLISRPIAPHDGDYRATIYCTGLDELLRRTKAEDLSTVVTHELLGSDSGTTFTTDQNGVAAKYLVVKKGTTAAGAAAATILEPSADYSVSNTNKYGLPATITLATALAGGQSAWVSYRYWYADKDLSWIVEQLLILAGITDYDVSATNFSSSVPNTLTKTTKAHFDAGSNTNIDTAYTVDSFRRQWVNLDNFTDGDLTSNPTWLAGHTSLSTTYTGWSVVGGVLTAATPTYGLRITNNWPYTGSWEFECCPSSGEARVFIMFRAALTGGFPDFQKYKGYFLRVEAAAVSLCRDNNGLGGVTTLATVGSAAPAATDLFRVTRNADGDWVVYKNGSQILTYTEAMYFPDALYAFGMKATGNCTFDKFRYSPSVLAPATASSEATPVHESAVFDANGLTSWGAVSVSYAPAGGSITVETYSSGSATFASDNDPAGWVAVSGSGQILSAVKRYLKVRITLTPASSIGIDLTTPEVQDYSIVYYTETTVIPLVNLTGMTAYTAIQECAKYACYEIGFTSTEQFFYRARTTTASPVLRISKDTNLLKETRFSDGSDRVANDITATFGSYSVNINSETEGEAEPTSMTRHGVKPFSISSSLLPDESANIADSAARSIYQYTSVARKEADVEMRMLVQYELGDPVVYEREHKWGRWKWGDGDRAYGRDSDLDFVWHADPADAGWDYTMRIEGIEIDSEPKAPKLRYELVEIL